MEHRPNKKARTDNDGMPAPAVMAAPPSTESVEPPITFFELAENWGDGLVWKDMDHMTRLRFLTPRVIETGRPSRPETSLFQRLPKAVLHPLSDTKETEMVHASECATTDVEAYFKSAKLNDEEDKKQQKEHEDDERDDDDSSHEGDGFLTYTYRWKGKLTKDEAVEFVKRLPMHLTFMAGFVAEGKSESTRCYCPCSKLSQKWRDAAGVTVAGLGFQCKSFDAPSGLLDHLSKRDPLYHGVLTYVNALYLPPKNK
jgi:hypothetical protein